jgi:large subunit ribosomal protein L30
VTRLVIRQHRSSIGEKIAARRTLEALGLRRTGQTVEQRDSPAVRGMLRRIAHLVEVNPEGASQQDAGPAESGKPAGRESGEVGRASSTPVGTSRAESE